MGEKKKKLTIMMTKNKILTEPAKNILMRWRLLCLETNNCLACEEQKMCKKLEHALIWED
jgi:hypothetical protein